MGSHTNHGNARRCGPGRAGTAALGAERVATAAVDELRLLPRPLRGGPGLSLRAPAYRAVLSGLTASRRGQAGDVDGGVPPGEQTRARHGAFLAAASALRLSRQLRPAATDRAADGGVDSDAAGAQAAELLEGLGVGLDAHAGPGPLPL